MSTRATCGCQYVCWCSGKGIPIRNGARQCAHYWERRYAGQRYVFARGQCKRMTAHPSGYCKPHRYGYRWCEACQRSDRHTCKEEGESLGTMLKHRASWE